MAEWKFSNLDKLLWEKEKISKGDLIEYYAKIARVILPFLKNRPLVMRRFPDGINGEVFFQKEGGKYLPNFVETIKLKHTKREISYIIVQDLKTLLYVSNLASIELHVFNTSIPHLHKPDYLVLDLDPLDISFNAVIDTALEIHAVLEEAQVPHFCKTSGATGMHIYLPMAAKYTIEQIKQFAYFLASLVHQRLPSITSLERMPQKRRKKVYIDYLQNQRGLDPLDFTIKTVPQRIAKKTNDFKKVLGKGIDLIKALNRLEKI